MADIQGVERGKQDARETIYLHKFTFGATMFSTG